MKVDDVLREIYDMKEKEIREDLNREKERIIKQKTKLTEAIKKKVCAVISEARQNGLTIECNYYDLNEKNIKVSVSDFKEAERDYNKRVEKLNKEFMKLKIAIATADKSELRELIENFSKMHF